MKSDEGNSLLLRSRGSLPPFLPPSLPNRSEKMKRNEEEASRERNARYFLPLSALPPHKSDAHKGARNLISSLRVDDADGALDLLLLNTWMPSLDLMASK